ncbi:putative peptidylprolyl isomerase [Helianthus annuus]|nr:putative peptidylprolyl isomerase [Helianthus annuus]
MCVGEKCKLKIFASMGYGNQGSLPTIAGGQADQACLRRKSASNAAS